MEIQPISLSKSTAFLTQVANSRAASTSTSASSKSSWRKFAAETTTYSYEEPSNDVCRFFEKLQQDWELERYEEVIDGLEVVLNKYLPFVNDCIRASIIILRSKCYEELNQFDLALKDIDQVIEMLKTHEATFDEFRRAMDFDRDPVEFMEIRKAGLLLLLGRTDEAVAVLRGNQPSEVVNILLYHVIEKKLGETILDRSRIQESYFSESRETLVALVLAGKTKEALELIEQYEESSLTDEAFVVHALVQYLDGNSEYLDHHFGIEQEFDNFCPIDPFVKWFFQN